MAVSHLAMSIGACTEGSAFRWRGGTLQHFLRAPHVMLVGLAALLLPLVALPIGAQNLPRFRSPTVAWVVLQYLYQRHLVSGSSPDVVVCSEGVPDESRSMLASWVATPGRAMGFGSIAMRDGCDLDHRDSDTVYIRSVRLIPDSLMGELDAEVPSGRQSGGRRLEHYRGMPTATEYLTMSLESGADLSEVRSERAIRYASLRHYLVVRRRFVTLGGRPWIVVCDESVPVSAVNDYVLGDNGRPAQYVMIYDPSCQVPVEVQRDTTLSALLLRKVEEVGGRVVIDGERVSARRRYPRAWGERFELLPDGTAILRLGRFVVEPPH